MKKKKNQHQKNKILIIIAGCLAIGLFLLLLLSYSNFYPPFLDKKYVYFLDSMVADIPFLPKTPKQVITKSLFQNRKLTNYSLETKVGLETGSTNPFKLIDLVILNQINNAGSQDAMSEVDIKGEINLFENPKVAINTMKNNKDIYLKVESFPKIAELNLSSLPKDWVKIDLTEFQKGLGVKVRNDEQIISDVNSEFKKLQTSLVDKSIFSKVNSFKKIQNKNVTYYEIKINLDQTNLNPLSLFGDNLKLQNPNLLIWVDPKTYYLTKIELKSKLDSNSQKGVESTPSLNVVISSTLSQIGSRPQIDFPKNYLKIKTPLDFAMALNKADKDINSFLTASSQAKDIGENLLTLERLMTVIMLLPKSI